MKIEKNNTQCSVRNKEASIQIQIEKYIILQLNQKKEKKQKNSPKKKKKKNPQEHTAGDGGRREGGCIHIMTPAKQAGMHTQVMAAGQVSQKYVNTAAAPHEPSEKCSAMACLSCSCIFKSIAAFA